MELIKALDSVKGKGPFLLLTEGKIEAFRDLHECGERIALLGPEAFAVLTLLWTGDSAPAIRPKADQSGTQYRPLEKPDTVPRSLPAGTPKQPLWGLKPEENKRPLVVLGDSTIRGSLEEIVEKLRGADFGQAKEALAALDFSRLLRTVTDSSQSGRQSAAHLVPDLGAHRVRVVGDYLYNLAYYLDLGDTEAATEEARKALKHWVVNFAEGKTTHSIVRSGIFARAADKSA